VRDKGKGSEGQGMPAGRVGCCEEPLFVVSTFARSAIDVAGRVGQ